MTIPTFPITEPLTVGEFWLSSQPDDKAAADSPSVGGGEDAEAAYAAPAHRSAGGMCRIEGDVIEVDVVGELTPGTIRVADGVAMRASPAAERDEFTVHASLPVQPWAASLLDCRTVRRRHVAQVGCLRQAPSP